MNNQIIFEEKQQFRQWYLWVLVFGLNIFFLYGLIQQVVFGKQFGDRPMNDAGLIIATAIVTLISVLFFYFRLETVISTDGIYVRFFPFHREFKYYSWNKVLNIYVKQYNPFREYGGWGLRIGRNGKAYNVSGNTGLQIEFTNNDKLLIGTMKPDELNEALFKIGKFR